MADYLTTDTDLTSVADAIRAKGGTSAALEWPSGYETAIAAIPSSGSDADYIAYIERSANTPTLPSGLTKIGDYAFYSWTNLALTSLPSGVTKIGYGAFYNCTNLALPSLPSGITIIDINAFYGCTNLTLTSLPSGVTSIGASAFNGCTKIAFTSLPSGVTTIGNSAFYNCTNLTLTSLPSSVTSIGSNAFYGCSGITSISCTGALGSSGLGNMAFNSCTNLTSAMFPNAIQLSFSTVFGSTTVSKACQNLEVADVGKTSGIAVNAFANCYKLQTLVLRKTGSICTLANVSAFLNTPMRGYNSLTGTVYVPNALISTYQTATNWKTLYDGGTLTFAAIEGSQYEL